MIGQRKGLLLHFPSKFSIFQSWYVPKVVKKRVVKEAINSIIAWWLPLQKILIKKKNGLITNGVFGICLWKTVFENHFLMFCKKKKII